jgi:hypothetical protein
MISEGDENIAHQYIEGMIKNLKQKDSVMKASKQSLNYYPDEPLEDNQNRLK